jgi:hypothetical protein
MPWPGILGLGYHCKGSQLESLSSLVFRVANAVVRELTAGGPTDRGIDGEYIAEYDKNSGPVGSRFESWWAHRNQKNRSSQVTSGSLL